jgi:GTP cyclohydrolase I
MAPSRRLRGSAYHSDLSTCPPTASSGLSKLGRPVEHFADRLQTQERLTRQVADPLVMHLGPRGVGIVLEAEHSCMTQRGVRALRAKIVTSAVLGTRRDDPRSPAEFFALADLPG